MARIATESKFNPLERVKKFKLTLEPFTIENDLLTPSFKLMRHKAKKVFENEISELYS